MNRNYTAIKNRIRCFVKMNGTSIDELIDEMAKAEYTYQLLLNAKDKEIMNYEKLVSVYEVRIMRQREAMAKAEADAQQP